MLVRENLTLNPIVSAEAGQGWTLELRALSEAFSLQNQILLIVEGALNVDGVLLSSGECFRTASGLLNPEGTVRFFSIDILGSLVAEEVDYDAPLEVKWSPTVAAMAPFPGERIDAGKYGVYELAKEEKWSVALLEIDDSPKHYHKIEKEIFVVVGGELNIEIDGQQQVLAVGEWVEITPGQIHQLKSARSTPVRVLCFNFPAFNPEDMHEVDCLHHPN